jgi:hypothetical protein
MVLQPELSATRSCCWINHLPSHCRRQLHTTEGASSSSWQSHLPTQTAAHSSVKSTMTFGFRGGGAISTSSSSISSPAWSRILLWIFSQPYVVSSSSYLTRSNGVGISIDDPGPALTVATRRKKAEPYACGSCLMLLSTLGVTVAASSSRSMVEEARLRILCVRVHPIEPDQPRSNVEKNLTFIRDIPVCVPSPVASSYSQSLRIAQASNQNS